MNEERRNYSAISADIKQFVHDELEAGFAAHEAREKEWFQDLLKAFPDEDLLKHCEYHKRKIDAAKAEEEFWKVAREEFTRAGVSALAGVFKVVAVLALVGFAYKFGFGPTAAKILGVGP